MIQSQPNITSHITMEALPPLSWLSPILSYPPPNPPYALGGLLKLNGLRGNDRDAVNLPAGVTVGQCFFFKKNKWFIHFLMLYFAILPLYYFCTTILSHAIVWGGTAFLASSEETAMYKLNHVLTNVNMSEICMGNFTPSCKTSSWVDYYWKYGILKSKGKFDHTCSISHLLFFSTLGKFPQ